MHARTQARVHFGGRHRGVIEVSLWNSVFQRPFYINIHMLFTHVLEAFGDTVPFLTAHAQPSIQPAVFSQRNIIS